MAPALRTHADSPSPNTSLAHSLEPQHFPQLQPAPPQAHLSSPLHLSKHIAAPRPEYIVHCLSNPCNENTHCSRASYHKLTDTDSFSPGVSLNR